MSDRVLARAWLVGPESEQSHRLLGALRQHGMEVLRMSLPPPDHPAPPDAVFLEASDAAAAERLIDQLGRPRPPVVVLARHSVLDIRERLEPNCEAVLFAAAPEQTAADAVAALARIQRFGTGADGRTATAPSFGAGAPLIAFGGVAGGIGTSTLAVSTGAALAARGLRVIVLDALTQPTTVALAATVPMEQAKERNWRQVQALGPEPAADRVRSCLLPVSLPEGVPGHLSILAAPARVAQASEISAATVRHTLRVLRDSADVIIADVGIALRDPRTEVVLAQAETVHLVASLSAEGLVGAQRAAADCATVVVPSLVLVQRGRLASANFGSAVRLHIAGRIPWDDAIPADVLATRLSYFARRGEYADAVTQLVDRYGQQAQPDAAVARPKVRRRLFGLLGARGGA